jgi:glutamyl-tRNA synthetase
VQFVEWFNLESISRSPAKFNAEKLQWINQQYLKSADNARLAALTLPFLQRDGCDTTQGPALADVVQLLKERVNTLVELADAAVLFYRFIPPSPELIAEHLSADAIPALTVLADQLETIAWQREAIHATLKSVVAESGLKMPKIAMPLRVLVTGQTQTPSIDATLMLLGRDAVVNRLRNGLTHFSHE